MQRLLAILLSVSILSSHADHWLAMFQGHEHEQCISAKHHLHSADFDCEHSGVYFASHGLLPLMDAHHFVSLVYRSKILGNDAQLASSPVKHSRLWRGPPTVC